MIVGTHVWVLTRSCMGVVMALRREEDGTQSALVNFGVDEPNKWFWVGHLDELESLA